MNGDATEPTDSELALRAMAGDESAFEAIYHRHVDGIARALASFAGPGRDELSDLVQEVFCRVIDNLHRYEPTAPFANWLYTVALNVGRNHLRSARRLRPVEPELLEAISGEADRSGLLSQNELAASAFRIVAGMPDGIRDIVALRIGAGLSYSEIAKILGIPEGTARRRMHDALKTVREKLGLTLTKREK